MSNLPSQIMQMVRTLHEMGYHDIYLYSGMSPSGLNWRFQIGKIVDKQWPSSERIVAGSVRATGDVEWSEDTSSYENMARNFERYYKLSKVDLTSSCIEYAKWYAALLDSLVEDEILTFYADYHAPHKHLLRDAPGFNN